ncbi:MAG: hypothetical protein K0R17_574 [Rariglobus sp.]|jgi:hypothetical protein|nr:hypothetical protein [Rariglobus sp.]
MRIPFKFRHWALVIGHWSFALCVFAQNPADDPKPSKLRFLFLDETPGAYALKIDTGFKQISSAPYAISPPFTPAGLNRLEIYKTNPVPDPVSGKNTRVKVATITPPANTSSALVILAPRPLAADALPGALPVYDVEFIDSDPQAYPLGTVRILNRGHAVMAAQFGEETVTSEPGSTRIVRPATDPRFRLRAKVATQTPGGWEMLDSNVTILKADTRITGVLVFSPSGMRHLYDESTLYGRGLPPPGHVWLMYSDPP